MRILLGQADRRTANFIARALRECAYAVDLAASADEILAASQGVAYAAILLHSDLAQSRGAPPLGSVAVCRFLRQHHVRAPLLLLRAAGPGAELARVPEADDILAEPFSLLELRTRLHRLILLGARNAAPQAERLRQLARAGLGWEGLRLDPRTCSARRDALQIPLTRKEYALLELLLLHAPRPVAHADIVAHVWGGDFEGESNLIEVYVARLRKRIDGRLGIKMLHTVRGFGYRIGAVQA
ncbi:MAG TPA: response regulator transcription factor [Terriglobales bacterium]|nr:response regulator transcription factor [Terriglobales bacterium]